MDLHADKKKLTMVMDLDDPQRQQIMEAAHEILSAAGRHEEAEKCRKVGRKAGTEHEEAAPPKDEATEAVPV